MQVFTPPMAGFVYFIHEVCQAKVSRLFFEQGLGDARMHSNGFAIPRGNESHKAPLQIGRSEDVDTQFAGGQRSVKSAGMTRFASTQIRPPGREIRYITIVEGGRKCK